MVDASGTRIPSSSGHRAVKYARKYKLVFSLLNEDISKGGYTNWDTRYAISSLFTLLLPRIYCADTAIAGSIQPLLHSLQALHSFDIETQVQYYSPLSIEQEKTDEGTIISEDQLKAFVNSAEWNLGEFQAWSESDPVSERLISCIRYSFGCFARPCFAFLALRARSGQGAPVGPKGGRHHFSSYELSYSSLGKYRHPLCSLFRFCIVSHIYRSPASLPNLSQ